MKNGIILLIASVLLVLCVVQKETRYGVAQRGSVDKIYNSTMTSQQNDRAMEVPASDELLTDSKSFEFTRADSAMGTEPTARLVNQRLLNISANSKLLNY